MKKTNSTRKRQISEVSLPFISTTNRFLDTLLVLRVLQQIQSQGMTSPTGPPKPANKLDNMLGSLQSDLNRLGVQTVAKGVCGACKKPIVGQVMTLDQVA